MMAREGGCSLLCQDHSYWTTSMPARESMLAIPFGDGSFRFRAELNPCLANSMWPHSDASCLGRPARSTYPQVPRVAGRCSTFATARDSLPTGRMPP